MQQTDHPTISRRRRAGRVRLMGAGLALTVVAVGGGLALTALPAYANVTSSTYTIGTPTGAVSSISATPAATTASTSTNFTVSFITPASLSEGADSTISVVPSEALGSAPFNYDIVGGSCIQSGGAIVDSAGQLSIALNSSCSINAGSSVQVLFTAIAPATASTFYFTLSTTSDTTGATSNTVTVSTSASTLTASSLQYGANPVYTITGVPVSTVTGNANNLTLTANVTAGAEAIDFYSGAAGYSVFYTPSGGSATADTVTGTSLPTANSVVLTLATGLADGDTLQVTAEGTNPGYNSGTESNDITVEPGNGASEITNSVTFGNSVTDVSVSPALALAGGTTNYTVAFRATDGVSIGGDIIFSETAGPTNFSGVTGIEVSDLTQGWHFVATGNSLLSGSATIPLQDTVTAGDTINVLLEGVVNPPVSTISDFAVSTTGDPVAVDAAAYAIGTNASPGVVVAVNPSSTGSVATYTISNVVASPALTGGTSQLELEAPAGTVFSGTASFFSITDATTPSGSGTVSVLSGGGTANATITVPNNINSGDVLTITAQDVINPSASSSTDQITIVGNVTGPGAVPTTTTSTTVPPTTTTTTVPKPPVPVIKEVTTNAKLSSSDGAGLKLECADNHCKGYITLTDVSTKVASLGYSFNAGKSHTYVVKLNSTGIKLVKGAKAHTIKVTSTVSVNGGKTIKVKVTLVG